MINKITPFEYGKNQLRVVSIDGNPYFIASDICLTLQMSDVSMSLKKLDEDEKLIQTLFVSGQNRNVWLINESGLYHLIMKSRKPEAKKFRKWVTSEVLPTIRKTGSYTVKSDEEKVLEVVNLLTNKIKSQKQLLLEQKPKVEYYETVLDSKTTYLVTQIAKELGMSARKLNAFLRLKGVQFRRNNQWVLYAKYDNCGYIDTKTHTYKDSIGNIQTVIQTRWTNKGRQFIVQDISKISCFNI